ncbi:hypothetical protein [Streptomyces sp. NBC_00503]|uniref:hypothetical protein n=1 Tax=Streptomyces sp. NBC_00503 TaxID=2903659 RepID=UPI002E804915|nr:hypothetical protein [Streptomyces sp. NBC_00503]WUD85702.1 hypothetical protein OG490_36980 [Streptomyces sp. NBC_00503]
MAAWYFQRMTSVRLFVTEKSEGIRLGQTGCMGPVHAIEFSGLTKKYGRVVGVEGLTLTVQAGEVFGFLGPNGAGKVSTPGA